MHEGVRKKVSFSKYGQQSDVIPRMSGINFIELPFVSKLFTRFYQNDLGSQFFSNRLLPDLIRIKQEYGIRISGFGFRDSDFRLLPYGTETEAFPLRGRFVGICSRSFGIGYPVSLSRKRIGREGDTARSSLRVEQFPFDVSA